MNYENTLRQLKRERLVHEFWETMERPGAQLVALSSNLSVPNYPRRRVQETQSHVFSQVRRPFRCTALWVDGAVMTSWSVHAS